MPNFSATGRNFGYYATKSRVCVSRETYEASWSLICRAYNREFEPWRERRGDGMTTQWPRGTMNNTMRRKEWKKEKENGRGEHRCV